VACTAPTTGSLWIKASPANAPSSPAQPGFTATRTAGGGCLVPDPKREGECERSALFVAGYKGRERTPRRSSSSSGSSSGGGGGGSHPCPLPYTLIIKLNYVLPDLTLPTSTSHLSDLHTSRYRHKYTSMRTLHHTTASTDLHTYLPTYLHTYIRTYCTYIHRRHTYPLVSGCHDNFPPSLAPLGLAPSSDYYCFSHSFYCRFELRGPTTATSQHCTTYHHSRRRSSAVAPLGPSR
jgi:hypothetical protein